MTWSKVKKSKKPLKWWYHKVMCEICYALYGAQKEYYYHLDKMTDMGFSLYGEKYPK